MPCPICDDTGFDARPFGLWGLEPVGVCDCRLTQSPAQSRDRAISERTNMTLDQIEYMVGRFLSWKLPGDFNPDGGINFDAIANEGGEFERRREPVGTNLFDYQQAESMVRYMLDGLPAAKPPEGAPEIRTATPEVVGVTTVARICHEANRAFCEYLGDTSQPKWSDAPEWQRVSAHSGVEFHRDNPDAGDDASHNNWMKHKEADGWVYGPVKDPDAKTHPCMVPFDQLPPAQQFKDKLFRTIAHAAN